MMYVDFNKDGSIKTLIIGESIQQGSNNVNTLFATIDGYNTSDYRCVAQFTLPDQSVQQVLGEVATEDINEVPHTGYLVTITENETYLDGTVKVNLKLIQNLGDEVLATYQVFLKINPTGYEPNVEFITEYQYNQLIAALGSFATNERVSILEDEVNKKINAFFVGAADTISSIKTFINGHGNSKFYVYNTTTHEFEDKTTELLNTTTYDHVSLQNYNFKSTSYLQGIARASNLYLVFRSTGASDWSYEKYYLIDTSSLANFIKEKDVFYVVEQNYADRYLALKESAYHFQKVEQGQLGTVLYKHTIVFTLSDESTVAMAFISNKASSFQSSDIFYCGQAMSKGTIEVRGDATFYDHIILDLSYTYNDESYSSKHGRGWHSSKNFGISMTTPSSETKKVKLYSEDSVNLSTGKKNTPSVIAELTIVSFVDTVTQIGE